MGQRTVSEQPGTGRMNGAWFMAGRTTKGNDIAQRWGSSRRTWDLRTKPTSPFPAPGSRLTSSPSRPVQSGICTRMYSMVLRSANQDDAGRESIRRTAPPRDAASRSAASCTSRSSWSRTVTNLVSVPPRVARRSCGSSCPSHDSLRSSPRKARWKQAPS